MVGKYTSRNEKRTKIFQVKIRHKNGDPVALKVVGAR